MDPVEAMEWAADYAERQKIFEVPTNARGYPVDGYKAPSVAERVQIIRDLAASVITDEVTRKQVRQMKVILADAIATLEAAKSVDPFSFNPRIVQSVHDQLFKLLEDLNNND